MLGSTPMDFMACLVVRAMVLEMKRVKNCLPNITTQWSQLSELAVI